MTQLENQCLKFEQNPLNIYDSDDKKSISG